MAPGWGSLDVDLNPFGIRRPEGLASTAGGTVWSFTKPVLRSLRGEPVGFPSAAAGTDTGFGFAGLADDAVRRLRRTGAEDLIGGTVGRTGEPQVGRVATGVPVTTCAFFGLRDGSGARTGDPQGRDAPSPPRPLSAARFGDNRFINDRLKAIGLTGDAGPATNLKFGSINGVWTFLGVLVSCDG